MLLFVIVVVAAAAVVVVVAMVMREAEAGVTKVCSSWTWLNRGTSRRSEAVPLGVRVAAQISIAGAP